jgi:hypothetical protein
MTRLLALISFVQALSITGNCAFIAPNPFQKKRKKKRERKRKEKEQGKGKKTSEGGNNVEREEGLFFARARKKSGLSCERVDSG